MKCLISECNSKRTQLWTRECVAAWTRGECSRSVCISSRVSEFARSCIPFPLTCISIHVSPDSIHAHLPLQIGWSSCLERTADGVILAAFRADKQVHSLWPTGGDTRFETRTHPLPSRMKKLAVSAISGHERIYITHFGVCIRVFFQGVFGPSWAFLPSTCCTRNSLLSRLPTSPPLPPIGSQIGR